jgi:Bifunctional DNA primase/polymerase, N-terminal
MTPHLEPVLMRGWYVFACHSAAGGRCSCSKYRSGTNDKNDGKHPHTPRGQRDAATDLQQIHTWATSGPAAMGRPGRIRESGRIQEASFFSFRPLGKISFPNQICRVARGNQRDAGRHELDRRRCFTEALTSGPILKCCEGEYVAILPNCRIFRVSFYCFWDTRTDGVVSIKRIG